MSETKHFKTESKRLLDLMINSIYTNKEIFLRELISNASDAIDKYHYLSLTDDKLEKRSDYHILIETNKENKTIKIIDNGIGMTKDELNKNLGTIASSGSSEFIKKMKENEEGKTSDIDIIGQFGVGFYSAFMVASKVTVETKSPYDDKAYIFTSSGEDTYTIDDSNKETIGTEITLYLRDDTEEEKYSEYLDQYTIENLVKKYSDYVRYPIQMMVTESVQDPSTDDKKEPTYHDETKLKTLNSMIPLWKKNKNEVTEEELNTFYKNKFNEYEDPFTSIFANVEGMISYNALLFIPRHAPYNLYSDKYEKGLQLYTKGVFIMDKCKDLIPDYLRFVKGLVDSSDLSLNISREMLQQNRQLQKIAVSVEKKILNELTSIKDNDFSKYVEFFKEFGVNLKYGVYDNFGAKKDQLKDLLIYHTTNQEDYITLKQYVEGMKEDQKEIYYASCKDKESALSMPQMDMLKKKGYDVLVLTDDIDEFAIEMLSEYEGKKFKSIQGNLDLQTDEEKEEAKKTTEEKKDMLQAIKDSLGNEVDEVVLSSRLSDSPVCLVSGEGMSFEMEKVFSQMNQGVPYKAKRILELNPNHELFKALESIYSSNKDELKDYSSLLLDQALLMEGMPLKNPYEFSKKMTSLMIKASK
ncbi:chaperone protein HtpG [Firmicutes bacterium CAG:449]|nr:chaperone protein HtpG [Firmicutes bacterium CAG:449]